MPKIFSLTHRFGRGLVRWTLGVGDLPEVARLPGPARADLGLPPT